MSGSDASLNSLTVSTDTTIVGALTASGLLYPTTDGAFEFQVVQTDAAGTLSFGDVTTTYDIVYNGEATSIVKGTPLYISGSQGANPKVYRADAANPAKMPVIYVASEEIISASTGRGIMLGEIDGINLTGYAEGTEVYIAAGGGWTDTRPTGSNTIIQLLGVVTKSGTGGKGLVLNPGPATLPNIQTGYVWIGDSNSYPTPISTSSLLVASASLVTSIANLISNNVNDYILTSRGGDSINGEANLTFNGSILKVTGVVSGSTIYSSQHVEAAENLKSLFSSGDEGGEIFLNKAATNTTIDTGITIDINRNKLRIFENGGTNRGGYYDITALGAGVGTNLLGGSGTVTSVSASGTVSGITLGGGPITGAGTLTLSGTISGLTNSNLSGTAGITNANLANPSLMVGSTNITLGATGSSLAGLSSITSTSFTGSLLGTASYALTTLSASYAPSTSPFPYTGSAEITGSLGITGSLSNGYGNITTGDYSHAEGCFSIASGSYSHAEGNSTQADGLYSHAEGASSNSPGQESHAEGKGTYSYGRYSHAEGSDTYALGEGSHTEGRGTVASGSYQHVSGRFNTHGDTTSLFIIGSGISDGSRSDVLKVSGSTLIAGYNPNPRTGSIKDGVTSVLGDLQDWNTNYYSGEVLYSEVSGEAINFGQLCYRDRFGKWSKAMANVADDTSWNMLGICVHTVGAADTATSILTRGYVVSSYLVLSSIGNPLYVSSTSAGTITYIPPSAAGSVVRLVGNLFWDAASQGNGKDIIYFNPDNTWIEL